MLKLKPVTFSQSINNGSLETWVFFVVSTIKACGAKPALSSYMYPSGVIVSDPSSSFINKFKGKSKEISEDDAESDPDTS